MAKPFEEGVGWSMRRRIKGHDIFVSGQPTSAAARKEMDDRVKLLTSAGQPKGLGPFRTIVGQAMQDYGMERLPFLKGALQEVNRINRFLRPAGLATLQATAVQKSRVTDLDGSLVRNVGAPTVGRGKGKLFDITLVPPVARRSIPQGLSQHRDELASSTAASDRERKRVAGMVFADVRAHHLQALVDAFRAEGREPATLALEQAMVRGVFNHAKKSWNWVAPVTNPNAGLKMPAVDNARDRVMSLEEEARIDEALKGCRNKLVGPTLTLLWETGMRSSETLKHVSWSNVDWEADIIKLDDSKNGQREVPLSPAAVRALRQLEALREDQTDDRIVDITYEALKASWELICKRADVTDLRLHDFRHTAATRLALATGNIFLVMALTGHKTLSQVRRYVNIKAADVVAFFRSRTGTAEQAEVLEFVKRFRDIAPPAEARAASAPASTSASVPVPVSVQPMNQPDSALDFPAEWALE